MLQRIANLFRPKPKGKLTDLKVFSTELDDGRLVITARVQEFQLDGIVTNYPDRRVSLEAYIDDEDDYYPLNVIGEEHLSIVGRLIEKVEEFLDSTKIVRSLPTVWMCKTQYFVDVRLRELRSVKDPNHRVPFEKF